MREMALLCYTYRKTLRVPIRTNFFARRTLLLLDSFSNLHCLQTSGLATTRRDTTASTYHMSRQLLPAPPFGKWRKKGQLLVERQNTSTDLRGRHRIDDHESERATLPLLLKSTRLPGEQGRVAKIRPASFPEEREMPLRDCGGAVLR